MFKDNRDGCPISYVVPKMASPQIAFPLSRDLWSFAEESTSFFESISFA
ncbi:hypothetical protein NSE_0568 [Neorickettsia sennetsu str. Miyayama]|uniref:Uncharacterized protein n=1 Tax=Ehrlichia sennetsu (strain ATCC VR-367 / Miyayama) TaxID=222891 RepID=Q2GDJ7_EHRS3|nr:hypothetical protein NSE_0568 [Neorickettsia sennetsu str. Miyayama]